ncbi:hypothetical protein B0H11DRAFT_2366757 [Mycena galericulata]|nr:hypothetical protein B0H11DRAFT_2366757 [Mycena galericulata]
MTRCLILLVPTSLCLNIWDIPSKYLPYVVVQLLLPIFRVCVLQIITHHLHKAILKRAKNTTYAPAPPFIQPSRFLGPPIGSVQGDGSLLCSGSWLTWLFATRPFPHAINVPESCPHHRRLPRVVPGPKLRYLPKLMGNHAPLREPQPRCRIHLRIFFADPAHLRQPRILPGVALGRASSGTIRCKSAQGGKSESAESGGKGTRKREQVVHGRAPSADCSARSQASRIWCMRRRGVSLRDGGQDVW